MRDPAACPEKTSSQPAIHSHHRRCNPRRDGNPCRRAGAAADHATYDDWIVRCETQAGPPPAKICEMVQYTQMQGQGVISQVAIGHPVKSQPIKVVVQVPTGVKIVAGSPETTMPAVFNRCVPAGCFADIDVNDDTIRKFRATSLPGQLQFKDGAMKDVSLPVSFKGFGAALDALLKE